MSLQQSLASICPLDVHVIRWPLACTLRIVYHLAAFQRKTQQCSLTQSEMTLPSSGCFDWRPGPFCSYRVFHKWSFRISPPQSRYSFPSSIHTVAIIQAKYNLYSQTLSVLPLTHSFKSYPSVSSTIYGKKVLRCSEMVVFNRTGRCNAIVEVYNDITISCLLIT